MQVTDSIFTENYSIGRGSIVFADYQAVYALFRNCHFEKNYAYQGGAFYIQYSSQVEVSNCTLNENFAITGGVAYVNNDGLIKLNNGTRVYNNSALNTCFLFLINTQYESEIKDIFVIQNDQVDPIIVKTEFLEQNDTYKHIQKTFFDAMKLISDKVSRTINEKADSSVYAIKAKINFTNTEITNNDMFLSASTESTVGMKSSSITNIYAHGKIIQAVSSQIELIDVQIYDITYNLPDPTDANQYKIQIVNRSFLRVSGGILSLIDGLLLYVSGSELILDQGTAIFNITNNDKESPMIQVDTSDVTIDNAILDQVHSMYYSPIINLQDNQLNAKQTTFTNFDKSLISCEGGSYSFDGLTIHDGQMTWMSGEREFMVNSIVFDVSGASLKLKDAQVTGIFTNFSSTIIHIENEVTATEKIKLELYDSHFEDNVATDSAGVVYAKNTDVFVDNSVFENNEAQNGDGGALYLECEDTLIFTCNYTISNSVFRNNKAAINGGAIKYTYYRPNISQNNTFTNNTAMYGSIMASYPVQLIIKENATGRRRRLNMLDEEETAKLNITDGIVFEIDEPLVSGSLMTTIVELTLLDDSDRVLITDNSSIAVMNSIAPDVQVMKSKSVRAVQGQFIFDDVIIIGPPGRDIILKITSDSIKPEKITNAFPSIEQKSIYLKAFLRLCARGEYQSSDNKCIECSDGFYTLLENQTQCHECPENAVCQEGFKIITDSGYWRRSVNSTQIYECFNPDACLGGYEVKCAKGYGGNLCQSCVKVDDQWYSRESANDCSECISYAQNSWRLAGVSILIVVYFIILIYVNIRTAGKQKLTTVYMRIVTNYFQILTLAQSYDLSWDDNLKKFLEATSFIAKSSEIILSIDCFVRDNGIATHPIFVKMIIACLFPIICIAVVLLFWMVIKLFRPRSQAVTNLITSIIIVIFISLPPITSITFAIYNCSEIFNDGDTFLALDMDIQCWEGDHSYYATSFGIPIVVIWVIGLPLLALAILFTKRKHLHEQESLCRYGFLYVGLNPNAFYWEILLHFRKVALISINVFFTTFKPLYRALIGFMLMIIYIEFLQKVQPYQTAEINDLEFKANIAAFSTFYGGLFFISEELPLGVTVVLFILILIINLVFWFSWFKLTFNNVYGRVRKWASKYISCLRKNKTVDKDLNASEFALDQDNEQGPHTKGQNEDNEKKNQSKRKKRKSRKLLDDSQAYALANDDSSRNDLNLDDSHREDASAYIINANTSYRKHEHTSKSTRKKGKEISNDTEELDSSYQEYEKQRKSSKNKKQTDRKKSTKPIESNSQTVSDSDDDTVSQDGYDDSNRKNPNKRRSRQKVNNRKQSSNKHLLNANAGQMIDKTSSSHEIESPQTKKRKTNKMVAQLEQIRKKKTKVVQNDDSYNEEADVTAVQDLSIVEYNKNQIPKHVKNKKSTSKRRKSSVPLSDDEESEHEHEKQKTSTLQQFVSGGRMSAFQVVQLPPQNNQQDEAYEDYSARIHTVKYKGEMKKKGRNQDNDMRRAKMAKTNVQKEKLFQQKVKKMEMSMQPRISSDEEDDSDFESYADKHNRNQWLESTHNAQRSQKSKSRSKSRNKKQTYELKANDSSDEIQQPKRKSQKINSRNSPSPVKRNIIEDSSLYEEQNEKQRTKKKSHKKSKKNEIEDNSD